ncbi:MAG: ABC transporter permease subunit [Eubacteriales bacterium]|nr:ABC transporter permease subunit [Eubacteriales bacterium]MDD4541168.1 ABC transporter permease subunit [Eubacteriales bacterium]
MKYKVTVLDGIGNAHPRKNLRLKEKAVLEERLERADKSERAAIRAELKALPKKSEHPYEKKLRAVREEEKKLLQGTRERRSEYFSEIKDQDPKIRKWLLAAAESEERYRFYEKHLDLSYDFELEYRKHFEIASQLPEAAVERRSLLDGLAEAKAELEKVKSEDHSAAKAEYEEFRKQREEERDAQKKDLGEMRREGAISAKALINERKQADLAAADDINAKKRSLPVAQAKAKRKNLKHRLKIDTKNKEKILNSDISDIRRKTPIEVNKRIPWVSWVTLLIPGLGQLALGQRFKSIPFFLGTLYIYLIALPYALGNGNYRGDGIAGLVSLAADGGRLDRSIIFLIEGVLAVIFLVLALLLLYLSFRDVHRNEKNIIKGMRFNNWFETRTALQRDGFPYFASAPAALVTIFIVILPIAVTVLISFTNYDPNHQSKFVWQGLVNYKQIVAGQGIAGGPFWLIAGWTVIWTLLATSLAIFIGFTLALLVNQERIYGKRFFRTIYLLPWAVPAFITIMFFSILFAANAPLTDLLNSILGNTQPGDMLNIKNTAWGTRIVLILLQGWLGSSYIFLLSTGILQGIPGDLYEAAEIDGATGFQQTRHITIPLLLYQTAPLMIGQYTFNFNNFSIIYLFNGGGPFEPSKYGNMAGSTDILISYIYKLTIENQYQGIGSAITVVVSIFIIFVTWIGFSRTKAFKEESL